MPVELVEEVWQNMCTVYRSKYVRKKKIESTEQNQDYQPQLQYQQPQLQEDECNIGNISGFNLENKIYQPKELEELFLNWGEKAENHIASLISYGKWLITKNHLDKVCLFFHYFSF